MKAVLGGIAVMIAISVMAGVILNEQFTETSSERFSSEHNSVRLGE